MAPPDLDVNGLHRFSKHSPRLLLEEHSFCEVPAGCGGVVLRWRSRADGRRLQVHQYSAGKCTTYLDGQEMGSSFAELGFGTHVFAFDVRELPVGDLALVFAAVDVEEMGEASAQGDPIRRPFTVITQGGGTWKFTRMEPVDSAWMLPGFGDVPWDSLVEAPVPDDDGSPGLWSLEQALTRGGRPLATGPTQAPNSDPQPTPSPRARPSFADRLGAFFGIGLPLTKPDGQSGPRESLWIRHEFSLEPAG